MSHTDGSVIDYMEDELYEYLSSHFKEPELLEKKCSFYQEKLKPLYSERILKAMIKAVLGMAEEANKRQDYRKVAGMLRWMKKYPGGKEEAARLAEDFRVRYKKRRAMMEEIEEF